MTRPTRSCPHFGVPMKRLGIHRYPHTGDRLYLLVCQACGSSVSTRTLRGQKEQRRAIRLSLEFA